MKNVLDDAKAVSEEEPKVDQSNDDKVQDKKKDSQKVEDKKEAPGTEEGALLEVDDETPEDKQEGQPEDEDVPLGDLDFPIAMEEKALEHEFEVDFNSTMGFKPGNVTVHITKDVHKLVDDSDDDIAGEGKDSESDDSDSQSSSDSEDEGQLVKTIHESIDIK